LRLQPVGFSPQLVSRSQSGLPNRGVARSFGKFAVPGRQLAQLTQSFTTLALEVLGDSRFGEARTDFEAAHRHLRDGDGKEAIRTMFPAVEVAAKVLSPRKFAGLAANEVDKRIRPILDQRYPGNQPAIAAGRLLLDGMKDWINASRLYRHGQEQQEPADPPKDFVIAHLSAGATYLRWMIELCSE